MQQFNWKPAGTDVFSLHLDHQKKTRKAASVTYSRGQEKWLWSVQGERDKYASQSDWCSTCDEAKKAAEQVLVEVGAVL